MRLRWIVLASVVGLVAAGSWMVWWITRPEPVARLLTVQDLPEDVSTLSTDVFEDFVAAFGEQEDCIGHVWLALVEEVDGGDAGYVRGERLIRIQIPTSPARFPESLVHELGHHLEEVCPVEDEIGGTFLEAQGFDIGTAWYRGDRWEEVPSEHFAEAVVGVVRGERVLHADVIALAPGSLELVARWGSTGLLTSAHPAGTQRP